MGGCGFLSRVDLPGPGALSVSFLGSRFLWVFLYPRKLPLYSLDRDVH